MALNVSLLGHVMLVVCWSCGLLQENDATDEEANADEGNGAGHLVERSCSACCILFLNMTRLVCKKPVPTTLGVCTDCHHDSHDSMFIYLVHVLLAISWAWWLAKSW